MGTLRHIDRLRLDSVQDRAESPLISDDIWFVHVVLAQCFLPYTDQKESRDWTRRNGNFSILITAGTIEDPLHPMTSRVMGLPFGAKPRLFLSYANTHAIKQQSSVIPIEKTMTAMLKALGYEPRGGKRGTIASFKEQITRFAACHFTIVGPGPRDGIRTHIKVPPIKKFDVWFTPEQTLWPTEIVLTDEYFLSLKDHAVPFDFRALKAIRNKPRAQDIYLWMTQRLCRIPYKKPLLMRWHDLYELFGGSSAPKEFKRNFVHDLLAAKTSYPTARMEAHTEGFLFYASPPPVPKSRITLTR